MAKKKRARATTERTAQSKRPFIREREAVLVLLLCVLAGIRIFVFSAAFPFFGNVDEQAHFDLSLKYAHGVLPTGADDYGHEASNFIVLYGSPEYLSRPETIPGGVMPAPIWSLPPDIKPIAVNVQLQAWLGRPNHEATQPPVYYALAAGWWWIGKALGMDGGRLLYWLRFLNIPIYALVVWTSYVFVRRFYPERRFLRLGVPFLLTFFPQDVFYAINNDVLSPLLFVLALYCLLDVQLSESKGYAYHLLAGVTVAAAFLVKFSNFAVLAGLGIVLLLRLVKARRSGKLGREGPKMVALFFAAAAPIGLWLARNYFVIGDLTGSGPKIERLRWVLKPVVEMWRHPIFTPGGALFFWSDLMKTFWRGELVWLTERMASPAADAVYWVTSAVFVTAAAIVLVRNAGKRVQGQRLPDWISLTTLGLTVMLLVGISIAYDFGKCWYPSRESPYLTSGRLISGMLVPFVVLYLGGLDLLLSRLKVGWLRWPVLVVIAAIALVSEIVLSVPVFGSAFNWYHLR